MIRMLIIGYCMGIRSERRLCEEAHVNLVYRWFCCLGLEGDVPDHSKCCSRTSSASSGWTACACEDQTAEETSFTSPPPPKNLHKMAKLIPMPATPAPA